MELGKDLIAASATAMQVACLPVCAVRAALVVVLFPPVFGYR